MLNLLSNAAKFTLPGGVIKVGIEKQDEKILISVKDTGIGIPSQKQHVIFQRFGQVDSSATRQYEGSGIGLFLVKSLVEMHNGTIHVQSEEHKGTEFIIELPIKVLKEKAKEPLNNERSSYKNVEMLNIELSDIYE
jgi:signal transduction histidine kinase